MSVQYGKCHFDGKPVDRQDLDRVRPILAPYGPDGEGYICKDNVGILYRAFHTTKEARQEHQPHILPSGAVLIWDGRLDNRNSLIQQLAGKYSASSTDISLAAGAYERWGVSAFTQLIGDWAISIWNPGDCSLILAKDFVGTRHLFYSVEKESVTWCTILDPLVLFANHAFALEEEYLAGWLSFFPAPHLTPYVGIHSVPPSSFVCLSRGRQTINKYWDFDPGKRIRYRTDREYEEHFRSVLSEAIRRRLRSDSPVLAELSGGMDSSSIVCMADTIIASGKAETPRLDTLSYYNDSEPNWDERPYFTQVERRRGRQGCHIDVAPEQSLGLEFGVDHFAATPSSSAHRNQTTDRCAAYMNLQGSRVVLSGIGGDEVMGGVPTPTPELEDLLARGKIGEFARRLTVWALSKRKPWFHLFFEALRGFFPPSVIGVPTFQRPAPWLCADFVKRNRRALRGYESRLKIFGALPSFQESLSTLNAMRRQLACTPLSIEPCREKRYPYLDRDLLEFLFRIPREQLVRPGHRRSLMRRALSGIVPDEVLERRRKAFVSRSPSVAMSTHWIELAAMSQCMVSSSLGIVDTASFCSVLERARQGQEVAIVPLMRTIAVETWLQGLGKWKVLAKRDETARMRTTTDAKDPGKQFRELDSFLS